MQLILKGGRRVSGLPKYGEAVGLGRAGAIWECGCSARLQGWDAGGSSTRGIPSHGVRRPRVVIAFFMIEIGTSHIGQLVHATKNLKLLAELLLAQGRQAIAGKIGIGAERP